MTKLDDGGYQPPSINEVGDLVTLTAHAGGHNKPCFTADGLSGTAGNCSGGHGHGHGHGPGS